jgi:hypothetical protein
LNEPSEFYSQPSYTGAMFCPEGDATWARAFVSTRPAATTRTSVQPAMENHRGGRRTNRRMFDLLCTPAVD